ncbi:MAG TPA: response regulator [Chitinophagaceae bacterium]|nr:response regulator [Chitinophagaceae bacterium]
MYSLKKRILVVDDVEMNQMLAGQMMRSWGCDVVIVENGRLALEEVQTENYDLVLMDIQMPEMDGIEATIRIRQLDDKAKASIPIIALTANLLKGDNERYLAAGMNDYLSKPISEKKLFEIVAKNLGIKTSQSNHSVENKFSNDQKLYDLELVKEISGGDETFVKSMVVLFLQTVPPSLDDLQSACNDQNWEQAGKVAHKLKSTIDSMKIAPLKDVIRKIESNGKKGENVDAIPELVKEVQIVMHRCMNQVKMDFAA